MKFYSLHRFYILKLTSHNKWPCKHFSTQPLELIQSNQKSSNLLKLKLAKYYASDLRNYKFQTLRNVCSIMIAINHVSWSKVSMSDFTVLDWNAYSLPLDFRNYNELNITALARGIREQIPNSDLYVLETQMKWGLCLNDISLRAMLILLTSYKDSLAPEKVIIQRCSVMNNTHKLLLGQERKSARPIVTDILNLNGSQNKYKFIEKEIPEWYSKLIISEKQKQSFTMCEKERKESLALTLLLTLSFMNFNYSFGDQTAFKIRK